ncbi:PD-(D/E)XK motif protein [Streptomyces sp. NPDC056600]|uniref:PD-(D/E)XK motif protein n=1 Tax=Streptomyces sp. NPDC056600 TaxID=3345874 RepID=UPI0036B648A4
MSDYTLREQLRTTWTRLEAEQTTGEHRLRVAPLPVVTDRGPLMAAVDHEGLRHLLVPVDSRKKLSREFRGQVLHLRKRPLEDEDSYQSYADLACLRADFWDLFTEMCVDVLETTRPLPRYPVKALYLVIDRWKALFHRQSPVLGPEQLLGLFGELLVLARLLRIDAQAHRLWLGPDGHRHDFSSDSVAVEVKASTATEGRRPRIHGLDQLDPVAEGGSIALVWVRLSSSLSESAGESLPELVERVLELADDDGSLLGRLARAGYQPSDAEHYRSVRFVVEEQRWYRADSPGFPGLTTRTLAEAGVSVSVLDVEYTIDLSGDLPAPMPVGDVTKLIEQMTLENA